MVREQLRRVDPGDRAPGRSEACDEQVRARDHCFGGSSAHFRRCFLDTTNAVWTWGAVDCKDTSVGEEPGHHQGRAQEESRTTADTVDPDQGGDSHDNVDHVLDGRRDEQVVASQACHGEHIGDVVLQRLLAIALCGPLQFSYHHDVHAGELRPDLCEKTDMRAVDIAG